MAPDEAPPGNATRAVITVRPGARSIERFRVAVIEGPDKGSAAESEGEEFVVGTAAGNQLVLADPTVSRHHFRISARREGFLLRDLGSTNGTMIGDVRVESAYLGARAVVSLGATRLRFELLGEQREEPLAAEEELGGVCGKSPAMRRLFALMPALGRSDSTILMEGETGTGKSLLARAIHQAGPRAGKPFVVVDCGSIPPTLIESELFGHDKGAFTGAVKTHVGAFERAAGGSIFLDEIGELPVEMQPKLLRALEERVVKRVGGQADVALDVRVMAATNRDLQKEINRGAFRSDLFYRLAIVRLRIPPLRERREDIPLLVAHFYEQLCGEGNPHPPAELLVSLSRRDWPGNVRELRGAVERAVLVSDPALLEALDEVPVRDGEAPAAPASPVGPFPAQSFRADKEEAVARWERWFVEELIRRHDGNLSRAARAARMDRNHLRELLLRHGVRSSD